MKRKRIKTGYAALARATFDIDLARDMFRRSTAILNELDTEVVGAGDLTISDDDAKAVVAGFKQEDIDLLLVQHATFSLGSLIPTLALGVAAPIVLWGVREPVFDGGRLRANALCGVNMTANILRRLQRNYTYVIGNPEESAVQAALQRAVRVAGTLAALKECRIGLVGYRVPGFYGSTFDEMLLRRVIGPEVRHVGLAEVFARADGAPASRVRAVMRELQDESDEIVDIPPAQLEKGARLCIGLRDAADAAGLHALAIKCWPEMAGQFGVMPCAALGYLTNTGVIAGCEADMCATVTMVIGQLLTDTPTLMMDLIATDEEKNTGLVWHCGAAAPALASRPRQVALRRHATAGGGDVVGITADFVPQSGTVTLARLSEAGNGYRMLMAVGEALPTAQILRGNPLAIRFACPVGELLDTILTQGIEHHFAIIYGDVRQDLLEICHRLNIEPIVPGHGNS